MLPINNKDPFEVLRPGSLSGFDTMALSLAFSECMRAATGSAALRAEAVLLPNVLTQFSNTICQNGLVISLQQGLMVYQTCTTAPDSIN